MEWERKVRKKSEFLLLPQGFDWFPSDLPEQGDMCRSIIFGACGLCRVFVDG